MSKELGNELKQIRKDNGFTVSQISEILTNKGYKASLKTIYSWENGNSEPSASEYIALCNIYSEDHASNLAGWENNNLPEEARKELESFIDYLKYKYSI